jgi:ribosomal protein L29
MMPISKDQARDIAKKFLELSHELGTYRFANWAKLTPSQRRLIEDAEWDLLNYSLSFVTTAVGIALADMDKDLKTITEAISRAKKAIATVETVKGVISIAAALVALGGAIASQNSSAILSAAGDVANAVQKATK